MLKSSHKRNLKTTWLVVAGVFLVGVSLIGAGLAVKAPGDSKVTTASPAQVATRATGPGQVRNFTLYVRDNTLIMPDGQQIYIYGFTDDPNGRAQLPGPALVVDEGDTVNLTLVNDKDPTKTELNPEGDGHTIHLHGLDLPSQFDGDPMTAPGGGAVGPGQQYTYSFVATQPGTYFYHCHQEAAEHVQMGMYGAFIVRPKGAPKQAYASTPSFDKEYTLVLSEFDSKAHDSVYKALHSGGDEVDWTRYQPNYFLINGKAWPDTHLDELSNIQAMVGQKVLIRLINSGGTVHSMHSHGYHFQVIGTDGRKLPQSYEKDTITLGAGERYDILLTLNQPGRFMFHDHIEQNTTNAGAYPGGMITMINVNKADGTNPVPEMKMEADPADVKEAVTKLNTILDTANKAADKGNLDEVRKAYGTFTRAWDKSEKLILQVSKDSYRSIEALLNDWKAQSEAEKPNTAKIVELTTKLKSEFDQVSRLAGTGNGTGK